MLQSPYHETIAKGLQEVSESGYRRAFEKHEAILSTVEGLTTIDNSSLRQSAFRALGSMLRTAPEEERRVLSERLIPRVIEAMKAEVGDVRKEAIQTAGALPDDRVIAVLMDLLRTLSDDESPEGQVSPVAYPLKAFRGKKAEVIRRLKTWGASESDGRTRARILKCLEEVQRD